MHLAYCDYLGQQGPNDLTSRLIARLCSKAVDFGKHGKQYVPNSLIQELWEALDHHYPDYFEKSDKKTRKSSTILGLLYQDIKQEEENALASFK